MGELVPSPVVIKAAIVGFGQSDHVIELIQYPEARVRASEPSIVHAGLTHIGLVCDDIETTRADLEGRGVSFLTKGIADLAGLRTTWFCDPWGAVFILLEKRRDAAKPYWGQFAKN
jgi:hypothetical protein